MFARDWGEEGRKVRANGCVIFFSLFGLKIFGKCIVVIVYMLKTPRVYTLKMWISWYVLISLFKMYKRKHSHDRASGPITSWKIDGEKVEKQWQILFSWAPKSLLTLTEAMKLRHLLLGRKAMTNLDSILKSRDITLPTKVCWQSKLWFSW